MGKDHRHIFFGNTKMVGRVNMLLKMGKRYATK